MGALTIRAGDSRDLPAVLALLDKATAWLAAHGRADQWGTEPFSDNPRRVAQTRGFANGGGLWIAEMDGAAVGALSLGKPAPHVPTVDEPEVYVQLLVTDRDTIGRGIGTALLAHAMELAKDRRIDLVRVDCYAGGDGALVRYYERQGFTRTETFAVPHGGGQWPGQVLEQRL